jgi:hypothetical protein
MGEWCHQTICSQRKALWLYGCLAVEHRRLEFALAETICKFVEESIWLSAAMTGVGGRAPFQLYPGICLTTEQKHGNPQSGEMSSVRHYAWHRHGRLFRGSLDWSDGRRSARGIGLGADAAVASYMALFSSSTHLLIASSTFTAEFPGSLFANQTWNMAQSINDVWTFR